MKKLVMGIFIIGFALSVLGCGMLGGNKDQKTPDGAWNLFIDHMKNKNCKDAWNVLSDESKKDFTDAMTLMNTMLAKAPHDFQSELKYDLIEQFGTYEFKSPEDLLKAEFGVLDASMVRGAETASKEIKGDVCVITTEAGDIFEMRRKGDLWYLYYAKILTAKKDFADALQVFGIADPTTAIAPAPGTATSAPPPPDRTGSK